MPRFRARRQGRRGPEQTIQGSLLVSTDGPVGAVSAAQVDIGRILQRSLAIPVGSGDIRSIEGPVGGAHPAALQFLRRLGDDVDDPGQGIGAVERGTRPADHLDAGNQFHRHRAPGDAPVTEKDAGERPIIHQHQHLGVVLGVDPPKAVDGTEDV